MTIAEIIQIVGLVVPLLISLVGFIIATIKAIKAGKFNALGKAIKEYVIKAENLTDLSGEQKKEFVVNLTKEFCKTINFKFNQTLVENIIEEIIDLTKNVNFSNVNNEIEIAPENLIDKK